MSAYCSSGKDHARTKDLAQICTLERRKNEAMTKYRKEVDMWPNLSLGRKMIRRRSPGVDRKSSHPKAKKIKTVVGGTDKNPRRKLPRK